MCKTHNYYHFTAIWLIKKYRKCVSHAKRVSIASNDCTSFRLNKSWTTFSKTFPVDLMRTIGWWSDWAFLRSQTKLGCIRKAKFVRSRPPFYISVEKTRWAGRNHARLPTKLTRENCFVPLDHLKGVESRETDGKGINPFDNPKQTSSSLIQASWRNWRKQTMERDA